MLYPSIDALMKKIDSKYSLVSVAAKRARRLQQDENPLLNNYVSYKSVGKALEEIHADKLTYRVMGREEANLQKESEQPHE